MDSQNDDDSKKNYNITNTSKPHQLQERLGEAILVGETQVRPEPGRRPKLQAGALQSALRASQNAYVLHSHEACPGLLRLTAAHPVLSGAGGSHLLLPRLLLLLAAGPAARREEQPITRWPVDHVAPSFEAGLVRRAANRSARRTLETEPARGRRRVCGCSVAWRALKPELKVRR